MSTTVDEDLLAQARSLCAGTTDAALLDEALRALLVRHRATEIDEADKAYEEHPINEPDVRGRSRVLPRGSRNVVTPPPMHGELWWCELPNIGRRPVVVLSRNAAIRRLGRAIVAPCTTTIRGLASEVVLEPGDDPIGWRTAINLDSVASVSTAVLVDRLGRLSDDRLREVCAALGVAVDCTG